MEIAQQLEPYVQGASTERPRSTKGATAADLLSSSKDYQKYNQQMGNTSNAFSYTPKQDYRKHQSDAMEFSSGSQFSSSVPFASTEGSSQYPELSEEYKRRSVCAIK